MRKEKKSLLRKCIVVSILLFGITTIYTSSDSDDIHSTRYLSEESTSSSHECAGWCVNHEANWEEKCTYQHCAGCNDYCTTTESHVKENVNDNVLLDHQDEEGTHVEFCEGWCIAHSTGWETKCLYKGCMACGQCLDEHNATLSEERYHYETPKQTIDSNKDKVDCQGWCLTHPVSWDHKCAYYNTCSGCDECSIMTSDEETTPVSIDRIYYINMDHRTDKREFMESWLEPFSKKHSVPYYRISGKSGDTGDCLPGVRDVACIGLTGLLYTNWDIMDNYNTTGITLVLEDDFKITNYNKLLKSIEKSPADWDVLRFDSWQQPRVNFPRFYMRGLGSGFRTSSVRSGYFCGGTHITVWRGDKVEKLRNHWDMHPRLPIDCALANDNITSYFLMTRIGKLDRSRGSDVPKLL